jgi:hypothetical protein
MCDIWVDGRIIVGLFENWENLKSVWIENKFKK